MDADRKQYEALNERNGQIVRYLAMGWTPSEVEREMGLPRCTASRIKRDYQLALAHQKRELQRDAADLRRIRDAV